ncbi:hypothetical protein FA132_28750 [Pseudomonas aeruginosa]|nr:hypothetical protein [Pseudomonas aeruginosa]
MGTKRRGVLDLVLEAMRRTRDCLAVAEAHFGRPFLLTSISFNLKGGAAGKVEITDRHTSFKIRYNRVLLESHPEHLLEQTVPHEVAHLVAFQQYGPGIKPHGAEWQSVMSDVFKVKPERCHSMPMSAATGRPFIYRCSCRSEIPLTLKMHEKLTSKRKIMKCTKCQQPISFVEKREAIEPIAEAERLLISTGGEALSAKHLAKVKSLLGGTLVRSVVLHGASSADSRTLQSLSAKLAVDTPAITVHPSRASIPDGCSHAIFFLESPTEQQAQAFAKIRAKGVRVRVVKPPARSGAFG